jgi:hypothetical protein
MAKTLIRNTVADTQISKFTNSQKSGHNLEKNADIF